MRRVSAQGFTLIEIMIVVAIVGLIMGSAAIGVRSLTKSDLRGSCSNMSGAIRYLFNRASVTGKTHRLVIDLQEGRYWAEESDDRFFLPRDAKGTGQNGESGEEKEEEDAKKAEADARPAGADEEDEVATDPFGAPQPAQDFRPKRARFAAFKEAGFKPAKLKRNVEIRSVHSTRFVDPVTSGRAALYFFPLGQTESAIIQIGETGGDSVYSLVVHPLTGRVRVVNEAVEPPTDGPRDDHGTQVQ